MISPLLSGASYLAVTLGLTALRRDARLRVLALWVVAYLMLLSFGVSKVSNFIYPVLPVVSLLLPATGLVFWRAGRGRLIIAVCATVIASAAVFQWDVFGSSNWVLDFPRWQVRPALMLFQCAIFVVSLAILEWLAVPMASVTSVGAAALAIAVPLAASVRASVAASDRQPRDFDTQMALRDASLAIRPVLSLDDVVLVDWPSVRKSHLYVMYWSGIESFEITPDKPVDWRMPLLQPERRVFLLRALALARETEARVHSKTYTLERLR